jgi:hypothetical protein
LTEKHVQAHPVKEVSAEMEDSRFGNGADPTVGAG